MTETGHLVEAPSFGAERNIVLVATDEGLFPMRPAGNDISNELRNTALEEIEMPEVTLRGGDVTYEDHQGEEHRVGTRNRYDGSGYDPSDPNPGAIEIVHRYQDSGNLVLTNQNPDANIYQYQAHGTKLLTLMANTQDPSFGSEEKRLELRDKILLQLKAAWGDSISIDFANGNFEAVGDDVNAQKTAFFKERVRAAVMGEGAPNTAVPNGSESPEGLPGL
jgi:hypothetical protein